MRKVQKVEIGFEVLRIVVGILIAYAISIAITVLVTDTSLHNALVNYLFGPFTSKRRFGQLMGKYISYLFSGCGMCFIYACNRFNLIGEGIVNMSPIFACLLMFGTNLMTNLPGVVNQLIILIVCGVTGGLIALIPAFARERLGASEMVVSIIMNNLLLYLSQYILKVTVADRTMSQLASPIYPDNMRFTRLWENTNFTSGIYWALIGVALASIIFFYSREGQKIRIVGANVTFAESCGINSRRSLYIAQVLGGVFAGFAGAVDCFGIYDRYLYQALTNIGMDGLIVAVIARKKPIFVPLSAFVLAMIRTAAVTLNTSTELPIEFATMMQAILVLFVAAEDFMAGWKNKVIFRMSEKEKAAEKGAVAA
ncbi:MAG: ABC transporter permease [Oscillospiraceae bacterium]|jgi:ABC-type uncharacterized transport system permease subunit